MLTRNSRHRDHRGGGTARALRLAGRFAAALILSATALSLPTAALAQEPVSGLTPFAGVRTFVGAPYVPGCADLQADIAILGVPFDEGTWGWPGERYGPRDIREGSQDYKQIDLKNGFFVLDRDQYILQGKRWADCGDVEVSPTVPAATNDRVTAAVKRIAARKAFPVVIGGDHSITFPIVRAIDAPSLMIVHFDAHLDTWTSSPGNVDHSSPIRRAAALPNVKKIVQIGMRGLANDMEAVGNARKLGTQIVTTEAIRRKGLEWVIAQIPRADAIYVTLDVDVMDPSVTPGTGTYEPGGLRFEEVDEILEALPAKGRVVGFDVVEVNPLRDPSGRTGQTAARLILDFLGAIFRAPRG
jgi:agmatinase